MYVYCQCILFSVLREAPHVSKCTSIQAERFFGILATCLSQDMNLRRPHSIDALTNRQRIHIAVPIVTRA